MLEGWYCRTLANEQTNAHREDQAEPNVEVNDESGSDESNDQEGAQNNVNNATDYKAQYRYLKRKFKFLIYENEFFQDALRVNQRRLLKVSRDRAFLLDRLLQYEKPENTSSESEETESSEDEATKDQNKKRKPEPTTTNTTAPATTTGSTRGRKRKNFNVTLPENKALIKPTAEKSSSENLNLSNQRDHMTSEEVERHLQSKPPVMELNPEHASATVPNEMFSNEPSLDSESNDHMMDGSSPTHVAAEECVPMEYSNN